MTPETEAFVKLLEVYGQTENPVSQQFYQGVCFTAKTIIERKAARIEELEKYEITETLTPSPDE